MYVLNLIVGNFGEIFNVATFEGHQISNHQFKLNACAPMMVSIQITKLTLLMPRESCFTKFNARQSYPLYSNCYWYSFLSGFRADHVCLGTTSR